MLHSPTKLSLKAQKPSAPLAAELARRALTISAPVDDAAVDRILATVDLAGTTAVLAQGVKAQNLDPATAVAFKRRRWGAEIRSTLSFLTTMVRCRKLNTQRARKKLTKLEDAFSEAKPLLKIDPSTEAALGLVEMGLDLLRANMEDGQIFTNACIASEYLPRQYWTFTKPPKMTRPSRKQPMGGEALRYSEAVLKELRITYARDSIVRAWQDANKPTRYR
jgi:hypothetical protein